MAQIPPSGRDGLQRADLGDLRVSFLHRLGDLTPGHADASEL
jgi:hypothetical protein